MIPNPRVLGRLMSRWFCAVGQTLGKGYCLSELGTKDQDELGQERGETDTVQGHEARI